MLLAGNNYPTIMSATGAAGSTIAYHAKKLGLGRYSFTRQTHDWAAIQKFYDEGHSISEVVERFNLNWSTLNEARARGDMTTPDRNRVRLVPLEGSSSLYTDDYIFQENSRISSTCVKKRFRELSLYCCSNQKCPIHDQVDPTWAGSSLTLHMDHINGVRTDNRLTNLRWLCANCHTQTPTYCGRNKRAPGGTRTHDGDFS